MLLKQIQKYTPSTSDECNLLAIAIEESENLLERVNKSMLEGEEFDHLVQLQRRLSHNGKFETTAAHSFDGQGGKLPEKLTGLTRNFGERKLLKTGIWTKVRSRRKLLLFLFTDFLLMTEASTGETELTLLEDETSKLKIYRNALHLDDIWLIREAESSKVPNHFHNMSDIRALEIEAHGSQPLLVHLPVDEFEDWIESISVAKRKLKIITPQSQSDSHDILGSLRLNILSASHLPAGKDKQQDAQYYVTVRNGFGDQSFSTNPVRGPVPVWNQPCSLPVKSLKSEIKLELLKYDQYKINGI